MILDESGSMEVIKNDMIASINSFIMEQQQVHTTEPTEFSLIKFSSFNFIKYLFSRTDIKSLKPLTSEDYTPNGLTALYDCIGKTINDISDSTSTSTATATENVLMIIVTDGLENDSRTFKRAKIMEMIETTKKKGWNYIYLSNDLSTAKQGDAIGCRQSLQSSNVVTPHSNYGRFLSKDISSAIKNFRENGTPVSEQLNN